MNSILRLVAAAFRCLNRHVDWHRLPFWLAVANLAALRVNLRRFNLFDTETSSVPRPVAATCDVRRCRTADGSFNDLGAPAMGRAGTRFGRNVPLAETFGETEPALLDPDPRLISQRLLARREFVPATRLNLLAAGWVQFMIHDWFGHGPNDDANPIRVPLDVGDDWPERPMIVPRTAPDPTRAAAEQAQPATFLNAETHWWDASQIYGSSAARQDLVRRDPSTGRPVADGKLYLETGHLPLDRDGIELAGVNRNWWVGLSILHTLFAREHNAICDRLRIEHPDQDGEWLFQKARLINAALLAKIHTVEWTPALLDRAELRFGMRGNWWGALGEDYFLANGRLSDSELVSGIPGSSTEHHAAPYAMTEEFVAVYRMHPFLPDDLEFRALENGRSLKRCGLEDVVGRKVSVLYDEVPLLDAIYSLGTSHPGALTLHN
ncbi:MAG: peroxidase family protein, partial [Geminicoccales bacterium]